jgi:hypothetical protein
LIPSKVGNANYILLIYLFKLWGTLYGTVKSKINAS